MHVKLHRDGVTLTLVSDEYRASNDGQRSWGFTRFCEHYTNYTQTPMRSMHQPHRAGEKLLVDHTGPTSAMADGRIQWVR